MAAVRSLKSEGHTLDTTTRKIKKNHCFGSKKQRIAERNLE